MLKSGETFITTIKTCPKFPKNPQWMTPGDNGIHPILSANDADHARYQRLLSHAFSERALREREYPSIAYIDFLIRRLRETVVFSKNGCAIVDMVQWFNFTTFDIVGDLALGESFRCLEEPKYHGWVSILSSANLRWQHSSSRCVSSVLIGC
jgi:cytochrome P450